MSFWTPEREARAKALWGRGRPAREIAQALGAASTAAVTSRLWRLGLARRPRAARTAIGPSHIIGYRAPIGPKPPRAPWIPEPTLVFCTPRPWLTREDGECAYPVDGEGAATRSCCNPSGRAMYCEPHQRAVFARGETSALG